ncbi:MAG: S8 family serine peptidase, partial [Lachnospiraceae bacterium]|nr:S8 family serine peptidase [Lachnospiraceae bacterium]
MRKGCRRTLAGLLSAALLISQSSAVFAAENTGSVSGAEENATTGITATEEDVDSLEEYGFPGGYELDSEDMELKEELRSKGIADALKESTEGEDYKSGMIWYLAESREEADSIAEAYSAVVTRYDYGVAEAKLTGDRTVLDAVSAAADTDTDLPAVEPVYVCQLEPDAEPEDEDSLDAAGFTLDPSPTWRDFVTGTEEKEAILDKPDTYLTTPSDINYQYQHDLIDSWGAWGTTIGSSGVRVAVVDSGVFAKHEDLQDENGDSIVKKSIDVTGQGRLVTTQHGTHVAGIIAGSINNGKGGAGVAPGVQIYSYNVVYNTAGNFWIPDMTRGILAAVEDNVNIINMSMCSSAYSVYMREALTSAYVKGVISFAAMGNDGTNRIAYPAGYSVETGDKKTGVIAVGATSHSKQRTTYSNYGNWCTVWAPGSQIMSSVPVFDQSKTVDGTNGYGPYFDLKEDVTDAYVSMSGTSMACPVAAGAAALYMSAYGTKLGGGNKELTGYKIPDAMKSVMTGASTTVTGLGKFINVGKMFAREAKAPAIIAYDADGNVVEKENGKNIYREVSYVMIESQAGLSANTLPRAAENYQKEVIVFTTDGASPAVSKKQLYVVWGKIYKGQKIEVGDLKPGTKTIVRAMAVTPQKEVSAVTNATVYTPVSDPTKVLSEKVNKITLKANSTLGYAKKPGKTSVMYVGGDDTYAVDTITPTVTLEGSSKTAEDIADKIYWATGNSNVVKILGKNSDGSCNIQALKKGSCNVIMYVYSRGKVKKSKSISVEVKQLVEGIAISGQSVIQPSAKAKTTVKYKAECTP